MSDDLSDRLWRADSVAIRAVVVPDNQDPTTILAQHGIFEPVAVPFMFDDGTSGAEALMGDGVQGGLRATLVMDQPDVPGGNDNSQQADQSQQSDPDQGSPPSRTAMLPEAYGMKPMAPVRRPIK